MMYGTTKIEVKWVHKNNGSKSAELLQQGLPASVEDPEGLWLNYGSK